MFGRIPDIRSNIRPDTGYTVKYSAVYQIFGEIFGRIPDIRSNIWPYTRYPVEYPAVCRIYDRFYAEYLT